MTSLINKHEDDVDDDSAVTHQGDVTTNTASSHQRALQTSTPVQEVTSGSEEHHVSTSHQEEQQTYETSTPSTPTTGPAVLLELEQSSSTVAEVDETVSDPQPKSVPAAQGSDRHGECVAKSSHVN